MNVYLAWSGEYSDKQVCGVFTTKAKAEEWVARHKQILSSPRVKEAPLDQGYLWPEGYSAYVIDFDRNGDVEECELLSSWEMEMDNGRGKFPENWALSRYYVCARDEKEAVKIASEMYFRDKAETVERKVKK